MVPVEIITIIVVKTHTTRSLYHESLITATEVINPTPAGIKKKLK